jgi:Ca-activated chloride channel homolog
MRHGKSRTGNDYTAGVTGLRRLAVPLALAAAAHAAAQGPPSAPFRSSIELTVVTATVRDGSGRLVTGLPREAFEVYEDGERQPITQFTHDRVPLGLGLLLDISESMSGERIRAARAAVERFLFDLLAPSDEFFVLAFNHEPHFLTGWTRTPAVVREALDNIHPYGGTAIYDAVRSALPLVAERTRERAALVVISDGADTASDITLRELGSALLRSDTFVYAIAIDAPDRQPNHTLVNPEALSEMTGQSGGYTEIVRTPADLDGATARIADELNNQYVIGYSSPHPGDGRYHSIRVRVTGGEYRVRARNGYVALRRGPRTNDRGRGERAQRDRR